MRFILALVLYRLLFLLLTPLLLVVLLLRSINHQAYRQRFLERLGFISTALQTGGIIIHAASVGEVIALKPFITKLLNNYANLPFGFMSLLGFLSLFGMLIKNAIVLLEEIDLQIIEGKEKAVAIVEASLSRLRPVSLAAITTILGVMPLIFDPFFADMSVTIMGGLAFATILTMVAVPVLYSVFYKIEVSKS